MLQESSFTYTLCIFVIDFFILGYPAKKWQVYSRKCFWKVRYYLMEDWDVLYHHQDQVCGKEQRKEYWLCWTLVISAILPKLFRSNLFKWFVKKINFCGWYAIIYFKFSFAKFLSLEFKSKQNQLDKGSS